MTFKVKASSDGLSAQLGVNGQYPITIDANGISSGVKLSPDSLTQFYNCTLDGAHRDMYRSGWLPAWFNQQWGGAQWGGLPDGSFGDIATGNIEDNSYANLGVNTTQQSWANGFKISETQTLTGAFVKVFKTGNPTDNLQVQVWSDNGSGLPSTALGALGSISGKTITSKNDGEWYWVSFTSTQLTAGVQYHLVVSRSGAIDGTNYYAIKGSFTTAKYPHGSLNWYNTGAWAIYATGSGDGCFLIPNQASKALIQSGGMFDHKLSFNTGNPINQSRAVQQPLSNFYDGKNCSVMHRGTYVASSNVWDFLYGLDHDRITVTINASGFPILSIYESDKTLHQVTSTTSVTSGAHDIGIKVRTRGDGSDYAYLYVDGVSQGAPIVNATITMDKNLRELGTARLGDGFGLTPAWTVETDMSVLPSAAGWTWGGTATEANAMSVSGGKLYQNKNGYGATDTGYYYRTTTLSNATGWTVDFKVRVASSTNTSNIVGNSYACSFAVLDGTKRMGLNISEYFMITGNQTGTNDAIIQSDFKSIERVITIMGKGSDYYVMLDGKLVVDGTGKLTDTGAGAGNAVTFGDGIASASENGDNVWDYVKIYNGGMLLPTSGAIGTGNSCSEFAHWSGDKSSLYPMLWNAGTPLSIKSLCGVEKNYVGEGAVFSEVRKNITVNPSNATANYITASEMETFIIGSNTTSYADLVSSNSVAGNQNSLTIAVDGVVPIFNGNLTDQSNSSSTGANWQVQHKLLRQDIFKVGLHKIESKFATNSGTMTAQIRTLKVDTKP